MSPCVPRRSPAANPSPRLILLAGAVLALPACGAETPTAAPANDTVARLLAPAVPSRPSSSPSARLQAWHQGFESGAEGWYDAGTEGALGWCGSITAVEDGRPASSNGPGPSAGRGYAQIRAGACNGYWSALGIPGGAPYAPGPDAALYSGGFPGAGYVSEVDVYLDPSWSGTALGTLGLTLQPSPYAGVVLQLAATVMPRDYRLGSPHPGPHWFAPVEAVAGESALRVFGHRIDEAGWYTFRFLFSEVEGEISAAFELRGRRGPVLRRVDPLPAEALAGPFKVPFAEALPAQAYGKGHLWFFDAPVDPTTFAPVPVAIDEHRVRPGR